MRSAARSLARRATAARPTGCGRAVRPGAAARLVPVPMRSVPSALVAAVRAATTAAAWGAPVWRTTTAHGRGPGHARLSDAVLLHPTPRGSRRRSDADRLTPHLGWSAPRSARVPPPPARVDRTRTDAGRPTSRAEPRPSALSSRSSSAVPCPSTASNGSSSRRQAALALRTRPLRRPGRLRPAGVATTRRPASTASTSSSTGRGAHGSPDAVTAARPAPPRRPPGSP